MKTIIEDNAQFHTPSASNVNRSSGKTGTGTDPTSFPGSFISRPPPPKKEEGGGREMKEPGYEVGTDQGSHRIMDFSLTFNMTLENWEQVKTTVILLTKLSWNSIKSFKSLLFINHRVETFS